MLLKGTYAQKCKHTLTSTHCFLLNYKVGITLCAQSWDLNCFFSYCYIPIIHLYYCVYINVIILQLYNILFCSYIHFPADENEFVDWDLLLWEVLLWTFLRMYDTGHKVKFLLGIYWQMECLGCRVCDISASRSRAHSHSHW